MKSRDRLEPFHWGSMLDGTTLCGKVYDKTFTLYDWGICQNMTIKPRIDCEKCLAKAVESEKVETAKI